MDFGMTPPEINSGRMYCGPGSGSMVAAAVGWQDRAAYLKHELAQWRAVTSELPAAAIRDAAPYMLWLDAAVTGAAHAAAQAGAAACAHELARAATVCPEVINANRAKLESLARTNCLAQTSATIADVDAEYEEMWAADADAMYAYARASAGASALTPFTPPAGASDAIALAPRDCAVSQRQWVLRSASDVISCGEEVMEAIPKALQGLVSSPQKSLYDHLSPVTTSLLRLSTLSGPPGSAINNLDCLNRAAALQNTATSMFSSPNQCGPSGARLSAGVGLAKSIGTLSVPPRWETYGSIDPDAVEVWQSLFQQPMHLVQTHEHSHV
jgi:PPE-repeat protein